MRIPKSFKLLDRTITVEVKGEPFIDNEGTFGWACYRTNKIQLRPSTEICIVTEDQQEHAFFHELTHWVLSISGASYTQKKEAMFLDEDFVELTSSLFHQAFSTMEYDDKTPLRIS